MAELARFWLDMGVDGFRLDVVNWFLKDDLFRSNPFTFKSVDLHKHIYDRNRPETIDICRELRSITDSYDERMMVGEVYTDDAATAASYCGNGGDALHMAFNFNFLFQPWKAQNIFKSALEWYKILPEGAWPNFTFSNHDNLRHIFRYRRGRWTAARAKVAAALLMTLRGTPFIYYGEELGMTGGKLRRRDMKDPLSIRTWPLRRFRRDMARTPMQWDDSKNSGFSGGTPWLPVDEKYTAVNVRRQKEDRDSLLSFYKNLIWLRKGHEALQSGDIAFFEDLLPDLLVYARSGAKEKIIVALNFTGRKKNFDFRRCPRDGEAGDVRVLAGTRREAGEALEPDGAAELEPYEVVIAAIQKYETEDADR